MKKPTLLMIMLFLIASAGFSQMTDVTDAITAKEKGMYEALKTGDMDTFKANLADNFIGVSENGIVDRAKEIENMGQLTIDSYELTDIRVMEPAEGVALVAYTTNASGTYMEETYNGTFYSTSTWVRMDDGEWRAIMHSEVEAAPMEETMGMQEE